MKKKQLLILASALCLMLGTLTGCQKKETTYINEGMAFVEALDYESALQSFETAIVNSENLELAYRGQGIAYMGMSNYAEAVTAFEKALSNSDMFVDDVEFDINLYLATAKYKSGDLSGTIEVLDNIIALSKKDAQAFYLRGSAKVLGGDYESGIEDLKKAIEFSDKSVEQTIEVYKVLKEAGHEEEGKEYLNAILSDAKKNPTDYEKGRLYYYLEDYENSRNHLEQARTSTKEKNYEEADIILMLGQTYEQLGDKNYAATLYDDYLNTHGEHAEMYNQYGLCKLSSGEYEAALSAFQKALAMAEVNNLQSLKFNEIVAYEYLGDFTKAKVLMESYLREYPDDEKAQREYEFLQTR